jgi:hypothetical protein
MNRPEPNQHHRRLQRLVGAWKGEETLQETPVTPGGKASGSFTFRSVLGDLFVVAEYEQIMHGKQLMQGMGVLGWDAKQNQYTLHWFDTFGSPPGSPGRGSWDGQVLRFEHGAPKPHGRTSFELEDGGFVFRIEMSFEGKPFQTVIEGRYTKAER